MILSPESYFYNPYALPMFLAGGFVSLLGWIALFKNRKELSSIAFFILSLSLSVWLIGAGTVYSSLNQQVAEFWVRFFWSGVVFIGSSFYFFVTALLGETGKRKWTVSLNFLLSLLFLCLVLFSDQLINGTYHYFWGYYAKAHALVYPFLALFFWQMVAGLYRCFKQSGIEQSETKRRQIRSVFYAFALGFIASVDYLPALGIGIYPFGWIPVIILWALMFHAIVRYRLWELEIRKDLLEAFKDDHRRLCLERGKVATVLGFGASSFFIFTDYFFGQGHFREFLMLRFIFAVHILATFLFFVFFKKWALRWSSLAWFLIPCSIGIIMVKMCLLTGGFNSLYFFGFVFILLYCSAIFPWHPGYQIAASVILHGMFLSQLAFVGMNAPFPTFFTYNWFLLSIGLLTSTSSYMQYRLRFQLKEKDQIKNDFFSNVSHELKTPVSLMLSPLESAVEQGTGGGMVSLPKDSFESVRHNAYRLSGLIDDLLDLTRSEVGKVRIRPEAITDTRGYFERIFKSVRPLMEEKGLKWEFEGAPPLNLRGGRGELYPHYFDRSKIDKVILNLLSNAIKFTPKGGKITMKVEDNPPQPPLNLRGGEEGKTPLPSAGEGGRRPGEGILKIAVEDTGIGIPPDKIPHIFDRFMQVDTSSTRAHGGMGIGLSLVKDFTEQHGGSVAVVSEIGKGTTFTVTLPRGKEQFQISEVAAKEYAASTEKELQTRIAAMREVKEEYPPSPPGGRGVGGEGSGETILVVDDNAEMRRALRQVLMPHFQVIAARDGEEGVQAAREKKPDLVLSDVMMPKKDGYGLLKDLKSDAGTRDIPVILLTAKSGEENLVLGFQSGADDYIQKPFSPKEVITRVRNLIRLRRQAETIMRITSQVAHDIRSPLSSIQATIEHLKESTRENSLPAGYLTLLELSARRLSGIADDLLKKGGDETGREKIVFSIHKVLDELVGEYSGGEKGGGIRFRKEFNHSINCLGNRERIQRALENLIKNAVEAIDGRGEISLKSVIRDGTAVVTIADSGRGMPQEVLQRVLKGGYTSGKRGGHGIGMKVVREVVEEHGWTLEAESEPGRGTTFRIKFPMPDSKSLDGALLMEEGAGSFELRLALGETLAVIDDDASVRLQWEMIAERKEFPVRVYKSWEDFQQRRGSERTAVVDYHFENSETDGLEIIRRLKGQGLDNLYLCTAEYWKPTIQETANGLGVSICPKPIPKVVVVPPPSPASFDRVSPHPSPARGEGQFNVLVIDDDPLIGLTWRTLKEKLKIRDLHFFTNLEAFLASGVDPAALDIAFVDLNLKGSRYDGGETIDYLKARKIRRVVTASGEKTGSKIPESIERCLI